MSPIGHSELPVVIVWIECLHNNIRPFAEVPHMTSARLTPTALLIAVFSAKASVFAQGTAADYARSDGLRARVEGKVIDAADAPAWVPGTDQLAYRESVNGGYVFMLVDAST